MLDLGNETILAVAWLAGGGLLFAAMLARLDRRLLGRWLQAGPAGAAPKPFTGTARIVDGDTIDVGQARVRLFGSTLRR